MSTYKMTLILKETLKNTFTKVEKRQRDYINRKGTKMVEDGEDKDVLQTTNLKN